MFAAVPAHCKVRLPVGIGARRHCRFTCNGHKAAQPDNAAVAAALAFLLQTAGVVYKWDKENKLDKHPPSYALSVLVWP